MFWAQYLNKKIEQKTWTKNLNKILEGQFSSSKSSKTRERILLENSFIGIRFYMSQAQFSSSKSSKTREIILL